jgi:L-seryl-tRNA(Sec) kinase
MKHKVCVNTLIGIPAAGKTSFALKLKELFEISQLVSVVHICYDDFITIDNNFQTYSASASSSFSKERKLLLRFVKKLIYYYTISDKGASLKNLLKFSKNYFQGKLCKLLSKNMKRVILLIIDDNSYHRSMRYEFVKVCRRLQVGYCQTFFNCELNVALERNKKRTSPLPEPVIHKMHQLLKKPNPEISWEKNTLELPSIFDAKNYINKLNELIFMKIQQPEKIIKSKRIDSGKGDEKNMKEIVEEVLRKEIHRRIQVLIEEGDEQNIARVAHELRARKILLRKKFDDGTLALPANLDDLKHLL